MPLWGWLLLACAAAYVNKLADYLVPACWPENERMSRVAGTLTIGPLAALTTIIRSAAGLAPAFGARPGAPLVAGDALRRRAPFLLVVVVGALAATPIRLAGIG